MIIKVPSYGVIVDVETNDIESVCELHCDDIWAYFIFHKKGLRAPDSAFVVNSQDYDRERRDRVVTDAYNLIMRGFLPELRDRKIDAILN